MFSKINQNSSILIIAILNFIYFFVEFFTALNITSISLFADSIDSLEDPFINFLILLGLYLSVKNRIIMGYILIGIIFIPSIFTLVFAIDQFSSLIITNGASLSNYAIFALLINVFCAFLITRFKTSNSSLILAAFYTARNDAIINITMIIAGVVTLHTASHYPDLIVGILIFLLNLNASKLIYIQMKKEY